MLLLLLLVLWEAETFRSFSSCRASRLRPEATADAEAVTSEAREERELHMWIGVLFKDLEIVTKPVIPMRLCKGKSGKNLAQ